MIVKARVKTHVKLYQLRRQAEQQRIEDQLTGAANRRGYERYSIAMWHEAARLGCSFSVCVMDIDHFKAYHDRFGRRAGDQVLADVAGAVSGRLNRATDFFARCGGEEFVAITLGDGAEKVFEHVKSIRRAVEELHIPHDPSVAEWVTISAGGVTVAPEPRQSYETYRKIADAMLYDAKKQGRNRVVWAGEGMKQLLEK